MARYKKSADFVSILEMQDILSKQVRQTIRDDLTVEERKTVNEQGKYLIGYANQMINAANFTLNAEKVLAESGDLDKSVLKDYIY